MLVSIIVPVYNVEKYLDECIQSIISQSFTDIEIILVDDGSTDSCGTKCDAWAEKDKRIKVIHKQNAGLSSARNAGMDIAQGKYIIFVDSDDYWIGDNSLEHLYDTAKKNDADVVRGEYVAVTDNGERIKTITKDKSNITLMPLDSATFYIKAIAGENFSWLFFFKRETIGELRFDETRRFQEDIDFNIRYFSTNRKCVYTNTVFYVYRKRQSSIVTTPRISNIEGSFTLCDVFNEYVERVTDTRLQQIYRYNSVMMYYWTLQTVASNPYFASYQYIIKDLSLVDRQKQVEEWAQKDNRLYPIYIYVSPYVGTKIMRYEFLIKGIIMKYGCKCKQAILQFMDKIHISKK